eukprot:m.191673 g.191673  ORF g.191673 m.191673 type:complete len:237 (-) comp13647_c2_seq5:7895-8605(-)
MKVMDVENQEKKVERLVAHAREAEVAALLDSQRRRVEEDINGARNIRINQYLPNFNESDEDGSEDDGGQEDDGGSTTSYDRRSRSESVYTTYTEAVYDEIETHDNEGEYFSSDEEELDNSDMAMSLLEQSGLAAPSYESDNYYNVNETQEAGIQQLSNWSNIGNLPPPAQVCWAQTRFQIDCTHSIPILHRLTVANLTEPYHPLQRERCAHHHPHLPDDKRRLNLVVNAVYQRGFL